MVKAAQSTYGRKSSHESLSQGKQPQHNCESATNVSRRGTNDIARRCWLEETTHIISLTQKPPHIRIFSAQPPTHQNFKYFYSQVLYLNLPPSPHNAHSPTDPLTHLSRSVTSSWSMSGYLGQMHSSVPQFTRGDTRRGLLGSDDAGPNALCFIKVQITFSKRQSKEKQE